MIWLRYCSMSVAAISILTAAPNLCMVMQICKEENQSIGAGRMFTLIGVSNVASALIMCIRAFLTINTPYSVIGFFVTCTSVSFLHQLGFNISLAYERLQFAKHGLPYHTSEVKKQLERKLSFYVFIISMIIGISSSTLRFTLGNVMFLLIPIAATRIFGYLALCVIYVKLYFAIKSQNKTNVQTSAEQRQPTTIDNKMVTRWQKRLQLTKMFFIGITSSFFISNLPTMITFLVIHKTPLCNTLEGIVSTASVNLSLIGMGFDAAWYFYMKRRSVRS